MSPPRASCPILLAVAALVGCGDDDTGASIDAGVSDALELPDAYASGDAAESLAWVELTMTGCDTLADDVCTGFAPLEVRFTAVAPAAIDLYLWAFGDESPEASEASPVHVYDSPGTYDVRLTVGGPGGTASVLRVGAVVVEPAPAGAACDDDAQCQGDCACAGDTCAGVAGFCTAPCGAATPCETGVCADLSGGAPGAAPWRQTSCVTACDGGCPDGSECITVPAGDAASDNDGWVQVCFQTGALRAIGEGCAAADGSQDPALCATGTCLDRGAHGLCAAPCSAGACPPGTACATFGDGQSACLAECGTCELDPWLACHGPGGDGDGGFTVDDPMPPPAGYCAPKTCSAPAECPGGACTDGYCGPA